MLSYEVAALPAGFPGVIILAWVFDVKAGRIERTAPAAGLRGVRLALLLLGISVIAAVPGILYYFVLRGVGRSISTEASNPASSVKSIAVLPFASLSSGEEHAYFHELLRQIGAIGDLRVISRTSVLQYKSVGNGLDQLSIAVGETYHPKRRP